MEQGLLSQAQGIQQGQAQPAPQAPQQAQGMQFDPVEEEPATEEEQAEYEHAMKALSKVLYADDRTNAAVMKGLIPESKIESAVKTSLTVLTQLDQQIGMDDAVIPELTQETVERVIDLFEQGHGVEFSETESQQTLAATWEGMMQMLGGDDPVDEEILQGVSDEDFSRYQSQMEGLLNG